MSKVKHSEILVRGQFWVKDPGLWQLPLLPTTLYEEFFLLYRKSLLCAQRGYKTMPMFWDRQIDSTVWWEELLSHIARKHNVMLYHLCINYEIWYVWSTATSLLEITCSVVRHYYPMERKAWLLTARKHSNIFSHKFQNNTCNRFFHVLVICYSKSNIKLGTSLVLE
jgi:hypothetical protein